MKKVKQHKKRKFPISVTRFFNSPDMRGDSKNQMSKHRLIPLYVPKIYEHPKDPNKPFRIPCRVTTVNGVKVYRPAF